MCEESTLEAKICQNNLLFAQYRDKELPLDVNIIETMLAKTFQRLASFSYHLFDKIAKQVIPLKR